MLRIILAGLFVFLVLFAATTFSESASARQLAEPYFTTEQIDEGLRYGFERRLLYWASTFLHLGFLTLLVATGIARRVTDRCSEIAGGRWLVTLCLVGLSYFIAERILALPLSMAWFYHSKAWGMTERGLEDWLIDYAKGLGVSAAMDALILIGFYLLLRWFPRRWWIPAAVGGTIFGVAYAAVLLPLVIQPIFNKFTPLSETEWKYLEPDVRQLAAKAEIPVSEILIVDASRQSIHTNAYFTGFGATQRIVLYDTLLKDHPRDEILSILGHEMGHWQHAHIVKGLTLGAVGLVLGCFLLARILLWAVNRGKLSLHSPSDPAGLPLIILLVTLAQWLIGPVEYAISRHFERQADQASLEIAGRAEASARASQRMAIKNKSNVAPTDFSIWLFYTHPPVVERIRMAESWLLTHPEK